MLVAVVPKLPMRNKAITKAYYCEKLGFATVGNTDFDGYLMLQKEGVELHFFQHNALDINENDGQVYLRVQDITSEYEALKQRGVAIHPNGSLQVKPWGMHEFALLDPDNNLLTFGEAI